MKAQTVDEKELLRVFLLDHEHLLTFLEQQKFWLENGKVARGRKSFRDFLRLLRVHEEREERFFEMLLLQLEGRAKRQMEYAEQEHERIKDYVETLEKTYERSVRENQKDDTLKFLARKLADLFEHHALREERYFYSRPAGPGLAKES